MLRDSSRKPDDTDKIGQLLIGDVQNNTLAVNNDYVVSQGMVITPGYKNQLGLSDEQIEQVKVQA